MNFKAEDYFRAGTERMRQARILYSAEKSYAMAMYCGGLAVECLLRAFRWRRNKSFEGRHALEDLLQASDLLGINEAHMRRQEVPEDEILAYGKSLRAAMNEVIALWHNNLRFASEERLRIFLRTIDRLRGIKGDPLKKNALDLLKAAQTIMDRGVALWTSGKK